MRVAAVAVLAVAAALAAGCGSTHGVTSVPLTTAPRTVATQKPCPLSAAQRRDVARARREVVRMHRIELATLKTVHPTGPPALENSVNRFLLDVGPLPPDIKGQLMDLGKAASALCQDCFNAIEANEPAVQTRLGGGRCAAR